MNVRKLIGRRALMELTRDDVLNVGTGIPNDVVGPILAEEDVQEEVTITVESGIYGGIPMTELAWMLRSWEQEKLIHRAMLMQQDLE